MSKTYTELFGGSFEYDKAIDCCKSIKSVSLKPIAETFASNSEAVFSLLAMPQQISGICLIFHDFLNARNNEVKQLLRDHRVGTAVYDKKLKQIEKKYKSELDRILTDQSVAVKYSNKAATLIDKVAMVKHIADPLRAVLYSATSMTWTTFESLLHDCWIEAVNQRPISLITSMDDQKKPTDEMKTIKLSMLLRSKFDLRHCMGTLLGEKKDFSGVNEARKEYIAVFKDQASVVEAIFSDKRLAQLQATRNLIVHRAGFVDEKFNRSLGLTLPIHTAYEITGPIVSDYLNAVIKSGCELLVFLDKFLENTRE